MAPHVRSTGPSIETSQKDTGTIDHHIRDPGAIFAVPYIASRTCATIVASTPIETMNKRITPAIVGGTFVNIQTPIAADSIPFGAFGADTRSLGIDAKILASTIVGSTLIDIHAPCFAIAFVARRTSSAGKVSTGLGEASCDRITTTIVARTSIDRGAIGLRSADRTGATTASSIEFENTSMQIASTIVSGTSIQWITVCIDRDKTSRTRKIDRHGRIIGAQNSKCMGASCHHDGEYQESKNSMNRFHEGPYCSMSLVVVQ